MYDNTFTFTGDHGHDGPVLRVEVPPYEDGDIRAYHFRITEDSAVQLANSILDYFGAELEPAATGWAEATVHQSPAAPTINIENLYLSGQGEPKLGDIVDEVRTRLEREAFAAGGFTGIRP